MPYSPLRGRAESLDSTRVWLFAEAPLFIAPYPATFETTWTFGLNDSIYGYYTDSRDPFIIIYLSKVMMGSLFFSEKPSHDATAVLFDAANIYKNRAGCSRDEINSVAVAYIVDSF